MNNLCTFHHLGIACHSIEEEAKAYLQLGYAITDRFRDEGQGVKGLFLEGAGPRLELLENLPGSSVLDLYLEQGTKMYHMAYKLEDARSFVEVSRALDGFLIVAPKHSTYFKTNIAFIQLRNGQVIELINV